MPSDSDLENEPARVSLDILCEDGPILAVNKPAGLLTLGAVLLESVRGEDVLARWGGEEFGLILRACPADHGYLLADRIRRKVEGTKFQFAGADIPLTVSAGFATLQSGNFATPENLVTAADQNLYLAKRSGRNKVEPTATGLP